MAAVQFGSSNFRNARAGSDYSYWRTGYPSGTNTTNVQYSYHPYKTYMFFDSAAIGAALAYKAVDSVTLTLTPGYYSGRQSTQIHTFRMASIASMPDGAGFQAQSTGILTTTGTNSYFAEALAIWTLSASSAGSGVIATGDVAIRLANSIVSGYPLGMLYRHVNEGQTVYSPNAGVNFNGGDAAPVITIDFHDAGSMYVNDGGIQKISVPWVNDGGVQKQCIAYVNDGGIWKQGIS